MIEPPWWIGSRNLTDSDKRLFGVACSIKQHHPPPPLLPPLSSLPTSLFTSPSFGLLCCQGYTQLEPSRCRGACQGAALRSPDAGRLLWRPLSHAVIIHFGFDNSPWVVRFVSKGAAIVATWCFGRAASEQRLSYPISML